MEQNELKKAVCKLKLSEAARNRILEESTRIEEPRAVAKKRPGRGILVLAGAAALLTVTVVAGKAGLFQFHNPGIEANYEQTSGKYSSFARANRRETFSLEEMTDSARWKSERWNTEKAIGGTTNVNFKHWNSMKLIQAEGALRSRLVFGENEAVKTEYTAEDPALLGQVELNCLRPDCGELNRHFQYVPNASFAYEIQDRGGSCAGATLDMLYQGKTEGSWFKLSFSYDRDFDPERESQKCMVKTAYDQLYTYVNRDGMEFVISAYGDNGWAECSVGPYSVNLFAGYMSTGEIEEVLDSLHLDLTLLQAQEK